MQNFNKISISILLILISFNLMAKKHPMLKVIKNDSALLIGEVSIITYEKEKYLIAIGEADIKDKIPDSLMEAIIVSKTLAEALLTNFIHKVKITTKEELKSQIITIKIVKDGKLISAKKSNKEIYIETIKEQGHGILKNIINIGKWKNKDKTIYFYALAIKIK